MPYSLSPIHCPGKVVTLLVKGQLDKCVDCLKDINSREHLQPDNPGDKAAFLPWLSGEEGISHPAVVEQLNILRSEQAPISEVHPFHSVSRMRDF